MKKRKACRRMKKCLFLGGLAAASLCAYWGVRAARGAEGQPKKESGIFLEGSVSRRLGECLAKKGRRDSVPEAVGAWEPQEEPGAGTKQESPSLEEIQQMPAGAVLSDLGLSQEEIGSLFCSMELPEEVRQRILGVSYHENENISMEELRYLRVLHMGFDGQAHVGELIVSHLIAEDILEIMEELYRQSYPIEKMILIDAYGADDEQSMADNNTSAFNYRQIAGSSRLSNHAKGLAIDINPLYNPYVRQMENGGRSVSPSGGEAYADRSGDFPYKIDENDLCCQLFLEHGFTWGGNWDSVKDYQHFEYGG